MSERKLLEAIRMRELVKALKESKDEMAKLNGMLAKIAKVLDKYDPDTNAWTDDLKDIADIMENYKP